MRIEVSAEVAAAVISAAVSALTATISFYVNRNKTKSEIAKMKLEFEHSDKVRQDEAETLARQEMGNRYAKMLSAIDWFAQAPDMNSKQAALAAINSFLAEGNGGLGQPVQELKQVVNGADAFTGPGQVELQAALDKVGVQFFEQMGNSQKTGDPG